MKTFIQLAISLAGLYYGYTHMKQLTKQAIKFLSKNDRNARKLRIAFADARKYPMAKLVFLSPSTTVQGEEIDIQGTVTVVAIDVDGNEIKSVPIQTGIKLDLSNSPNDRQARDKLISFVSGQVAITEFVFATYGEDFGYYSFTDAQGNTATTAAM